MGCCSAVPSFRNFKRGHHNNKDSSDKAKKPKERYHVHHNMGNGDEASLWVTIKNRRKGRPQTNRIKTTRYNIITFIPKNLFEQFHRIANIYFAILIGLNWIPIITAISRNVIHFETSFSR